MIHSPEGRLVTLERGGDVGRGRGSQRGALERGGDRLAGSRGGADGPHCVREPRIGLL